MRTAETSPARTLAAVLFGLALLATATARADVGDEYVTDLQAQGKKLVLLAAGSETADGSDPSVLRIREDGSLDPSFGVGGRWTMTVPGTQYVQGVAVARDRSLAVAIQNGGTFDDATVTVVRLTRDGASVDAFGTAGSTDFEVGTVGGGGGGGVGVRGAAIDRDDRVLVCGWGTIDGGTSSFIARLTSAGALDTTFGTGGIVVVDLAASESLQSVVADRNGRVVACGQADGELLVLRLLETGAFDTSFGTAGVIRASPNGNGVMRGLALAGRKRIVASGVSGNRAVAARFLLDGTPDPKFAGDGYAVLSDDPLVSDGYALVPGSGASMTVIGLSNNAERTLFLARFKKNGRLHPKFGAGGVVRSDAAPAPASVFTAAPGRRGRIVTAGTIEAGGTRTTRDVLLARFDKRGRLVRSFGTDGLAIIDLAD